MDIDVLSKLFPNVLTLLTQLGATAVIYILYKKYLHEPVLDFLEKRQDLIADELSSAKKLKNEALERKVQSDEEFANIRLEAAKLKEKMVAEANLEKAKIIENAHQEAIKIKEANDRALESDREALYAEVSDYILDVASTVNKRVLENITFSEADMLNALQKEIDSDEYQH